MKKKTETSVTSHTPTPWKVAMPLGEGDIQILSVKVNAYGNFINAVVPFRVFSNEDVANAEFIVRAVNSHEELLSAMKLATHHLYATDENAKAINILLEAIAKAEGR